MKTPIKAEEYQISEGRTSQNIAAEIIAIREQTKNALQAIAVSAAIEIGKRLKEAKSLVPYGNWGDWLKDNLDYSDRTAQNLMKLAEESEKAGFTPLLDLSYTQAVQLIGLPARDREEFMDENDVTGMSTRELKDAIKKTIARLNEELKKAEQVQLKDTQALAEAKAEVPEPVQKELEELRESERRRKAAEENAQEAMKREGAEYTFRALYEQLKLDYERMIAALREMDTEKQKKYRDAMVKALEAMKKKAAGSLA